MNRAPMIADPKTALWVGVAMSLAGSVMLWDALEHRGKSRPWALRWLPGA